MAMMMMTKVSPLSSSSLLLLLHSLVPALPLAFSLEFWMQIHFVELISWEP